MKRLLIVLIIVALTASNVIPMCTLQIARFDLCDHIYRIFKSMIKILLIISVNACKVYLSHGQC